MLHSITFDLYSALINEGKCFKIYFEVQGRKFYVEKKKLEGCIRSWFHNTKHLTVCLIACFLPGSWPVLLPLNELCQAPTEGLCGLWTNKASISTFFCTKTIFPSTAGFSNIHPSANLTKKFPHHAPTWWLKAFRAWTLNTGCHSYLVANISEIRQVHYERLENKTKGHIPSLTSAVPLVDSLPSLKNISYVFANLQEKSHHQF